MAIKEIAFTAYPSNDVGKLMDFYSKVVGLKPGETYEEDGKVQYAEYPLGNGWFSVMNAQWIDRPAGSGVGVAFEVDDIEKTLGELKAKGVKADDSIYDTPVCRVASFEDPEGNKVTLHQSTR